MGWYSDEYLQQLRDERARYEQQSPGDWRLAADPMSVQRIEAALQMGQWQREGNLQAITQYEATQEALRSGGETAPAWANLYLSDEYLQQLLDEMATYRAQYGRNWERYVDPMVAERINKGIHQWYNQRTKPKEGGAKGEREYIQDEPMAQHLEAALRQPEPELPPTIENFKVGNKLGRPMPKTAKTRAKIDFVLGGKAGTTIDKTTGRVVFRDIRLV